MSGPTRSAPIAPPPGFVPFEPSDLERSLPWRFEQQVLRHGGRLAIRFAGQSLTYTQLNEAANRLAHSIVARRGPASEPVAVVLPIGVSVVVAALAILKAGKIFAPIDLTSPPARMRLMLEDTQAGLVLTDGAHLPDVAALCADLAGVIDLDNLDASYPCDNSGLELSPHAVACILYTSGSTGKPKGVIHRHDSILHFIAGYTNSCYITPYDHMTLIHATHVIGFQRDTFGALLNGAALFPFDLRREGPGRLAELLTREDITICNATTTIYRHLLSVLPDAQLLPSVRIAKFGGEPTYRGDIQALWKHVAPECICFLTLGSTETRITHAAFFARETTLAHEMMPVGFPVDDTETTLRNEHGAPVPEGDVGEITVRSRYIAAGYWRRPEQTAAVFKPDPDGGDAHVFYSGDLGRMLPDGQMEYLGRTDDQVKIRSFRVSIGEVEHALRGAAGVREAVVSAHKDPNGSNYLAAYVVAVADRPLEIGELRRALAERLPDYMIPARFVLMAVLPQTGSGKINRGALPDPGRIRPALDVAYAAPATPFEKLIAAIWHEVLMLEGIGVHDRFLDLGGHSLQAVQIIARVVERLRVDLPLGVLFETPTIAEMAALVALHEARGAGADSVERMLRELESMAGSEAEAHLATKLTGPANSAARPAQGSDVEHDAARPHADSSS